MAAGFWRVRQFGACVSAAAFQTSICPSPIPPPEKEARRKAASRLFLPRGWRRTRYAALVAIASFIAYLCVRRFWLIFGVVAVGCSVLNLAHKLVKHDSHIRPADLAYWLPMIFCYGAAVAFPITVLCGLPLHFYRRRKMRR